MLKIEVQQFNSSVSSLWMFMEHFRVTSAPGIHQWLGPDAVVCQGIFSGRTIWGIYTFRNFRWSNVAIENPSWMVFPLKPSIGTAEFSSYDWWHCRAHGEKHPIFSHFGGTKSSKCLVLQRDTNGEESNQNKSVPFPTHIELKMILIAHACTPN